MIYKNSGIKLFFAENVFLEFKYQSSQYICILKLLENIRSISLDSLMPKRSKPRKCVRCEKSFIFFLPLLTSCRVSCLLILLRSCLSPIFEIFSVARTSASFFHVIASRPRRNSPHRQIKLESLTRHAGNRRIYLYLRPVRLGNSGVFLKFLRPSRSFLLGDVRQCHISD